MQTAELRHRSIAWYVQVLKSPDAPRNEKRIALRFVAHLVGDINQPLHAGFAEDRGGNSVEVRFNGRKENLHSLSDTALVELEEGTPAEIAARVQNAVTSDELQQWQRGTSILRFTVNSASLRDKPASCEDGKGAT